MSFNTLSVTVPGAVTWNSAGTGRYVNATTTFGGPADYILLSPVKAMKGSVTGRKTFTDSRYVEVDVTSGGVTKRLGYRITITHEIDPGVDVATADLALQAMDNLTTSSYVTRRLNGEV